MFGNSKKRKANRVDTLIGQHTEIHGDIRFTGGLHIDGTVNGSVSADNDGYSALSLNECGTINGEVRVPHVSLNGTVVGDVHVSEHVELAAKAQIKGDVHYNLIEMAIGAEVNGKLVHSLEPAESPLALGHEELADKS